MTKAVEKAKNARAKKGASAKKPAAGKKAVAKVDPADAATEALEKAQTNLGNIAKEVNKRMESFAKKAKDADDQRLSAALRLAEAKEVCVANGLKFQDWCDENIDQSYETARKLAVAGASGDPALAIEDMRLKNKAANKKSRAEAKKAREKAKADKAKAKKKADEAAAKDAKNDEADESGADSSVDAMRNIYNELGEEERNEIFFWIAEDRGYDLQDAPEDNEEAAGEEGTGVDPEVEPEADDGTGPENF